MAALDKNEPQKPSSAIQKTGRADAGKGGIAPVTVNDLQDVVAAQQAQVNVGEQQANETAKLAVVAFNRQMELNKPVVLEAMAEIATRHLGEMSDIWSDAMGQASSRMAESATPVDLTEVTGG